MNQINELFKQQLIWKSLKKKRCHYVTEMYEEDKCWLRMNDFPDEPLWTIFFNGEEVDFDDAPQFWTIIYD